MKKRNTKIQEFVTPNSGKPICARFGCKSCSIIASGDDKNVLSLWRLNKEKPILSLTNQTTYQSVQSEITSVCFGVEDDEVYAGTSRGSINIWDLNAQKLNSTLKGHMVSVNCITQFPYPDQRHLILSGSYDSQVKLWDLRQRQTVSVFKGHTMQINSIRVSPDARWFVSGSQDSLIKVWDITAGKCLNTFDLHDSPILSLKFNPYDLTLATGSADKTVKYWDLDNFGLLYSSKPEATGIQQLTFNEDGKFLYTAAQENLKVWYVENDKLTHLDTIETSWRGVQDLSIQQNNGTEETLLGVTITPIYFGLWACPLKETNQNPEVSADQFLAQRKEEHKKKQAQSKPTSISRGQSNEVGNNRSPSKDFGDRNQDSPPKNDMINEMNKPLIKGYSQNSNDNNNNNGGGNNQNKNNPDNQNANPNMGGGYPYPPNMGFDPNNQQQQQQQQYNYYPPNQQYPYPYQNMPPNYNPYMNMQGGQYPNGNGNNNNQMQPENPYYQQGQGPYYQGPPPNNNNNYDPNNDNQQKQQNSNKPPKPQSGSSPQKILPEEPSTDETSRMTGTSIIKVSGADPNNLNITSFLEGLEGGSKNQEHEAINEVMKDHTKFKRFMVQRLNYLKPILHWWNSGNIRSALNAINAHTNVNDPTLIMDLLNMSVETNKIGQMNVDAACIFLQKSVLLIDSKFDHHVKMGLQFISKMFKQFHDEIVNVKCVGVVNMVDLAREERMKKYDKLIDEFEKISTRPRIKKLASKNREEVGEIAVRVLSELEIFLNKIKKNDKK